MSATEISPSQSIEASLLNRHPSMSPQASFADHDTNAYPPPPPPVHDTTANADSDSMDHQPAQAAAASEQPNQDSTPTDVQNHDRMALDDPPLPPDPAAFDAAPAPSPPSQPVPEDSSTQPDSTNAENSMTVQSEPQVLVAVHATEASSPSEDTSGPSDGQERSGEGPTETSAGTRSEEDDNGEGGDNDDDDESSSDEDDYWGGNRNFVANLKEDTSTPGEDELKDLEGRSEHSALEDGYFEGKAFTSLDDPEYAPVATGTVKWTLKGFHGTKETPNKLRVMRSEPVTIGGYQWNIKIYPHGNDGTDYVSVYVECCGPEGASEPAVVSSDDASMQGVTTEENSVEGTSESKEANETTADASKPLPDGSWEVAAQVGCVMYNPEEPRTYAFEHSNHQFHNNGPDCGWVRFYGPWSTVHQRRPLQRQAMLRNDKLAFTAYIRVIHDPTRALWFRYGEDGIWDSIIRTGLRGMSAGDSAGASVMAALAPWFHLQPFRKLILETNVPNMASEPKKPVRPLFQALQDALYKKYTPENHSPGYPESLTNVRRTLQLYGLEVRQSTDVVEIWETLRNALNAEFSNENNGANLPDVLSFIKTVRQNVQPCLPSEESETKEEPHSVQEIINQASEDDQKSYKEWGGHHQSGQAMPPVLQVELCRQRYDSTARKWKRLTHHIKMENTISVGKTQKAEYRLFGMVVSKGELGSGRVYPIVRAAGPGSQWARYKSHNVTFLTHRQAVDSHEGKGISREGTESVAQIAIYVRSDLADEVLPPPEFRPTSKVMFPLERQPSAPADPDTVRVMVHGDALLKNYEGLSFLDPWNTDNVHSTELEIPATSSLIDVQKKLQELYPTVERSDQFRLWTVGAYASPVPHPRDLYLVESIPSTPLASLPTFFGGIRLWYTLVPMEKIDPEGSFKTLITEIMPEVPPPAEPFIPEAPPTGASAAEVPPPHPPSGESQQPTDPSTAPAIDPSLEAPMEVAPEGSPTSPPQESEQESPSDSNQNQDVVMGGTQDQPPTNRDGEPNDSEAPTQENTTQDTPVPDSQISEPPPPPAPILKKEKIPDWQCREETYLRFKAFDPIEQKTIGLGSGFFPRDKNLKDIIASFDIPFKKIKLFQEVSQNAHSNMSVDDTIQTAGLSNLSVVVLARNDLSENDKEVLRSRGDIFDFGEWYSRQYSLNHFSHKESFESGCYYGKRYARAPLHNGKYFGDSVIINTNGDAYKGNCLDGEFHGHGVMHYANGNTYTGDWVNGLPEGQGTMIYNQTGNKYVGGWRTGRKHGRGVMTYEVADEEMQLCKICYENEMDALFYRCGHVAACESCARQVNDCPVCRRQVDAVVRIWRTV